MTTSAQERAENLAMIRDSAAAITGESRDFARIRKLRFTATGFERDTWMRAAELGWLGLLLPEAEGGIGLGDLELAAIAEELGRALVPEPLLAAIAVVPALPQAWREPVLAGEKIVLPVWPANGAGGTARRVPMGQGADAFLAETDDGLALHRADPAGMTRDATQDGGHFASFALGAPEEVVAGRTLRRAYERATLASAAYLLGTCETAFALALEHLKVRTQFGQVIGNFQALQHRAVDLRVALSLSRAVLDEAAAQLDADAAELPSDATLMAISRAKARMGETAMLVAREATQFHGAIGITDEHDVSLCTRKILTLNNQYGTAGAHRRRYLGLLRGPAAACRQQKEGQPS